MAPEQSSTDGNSRPPTRTTVSFARRLLGLVKLLATTLLALVTLAKSLGWL